MNQTKLILLALIALAGSQITLILYINKLTSRLNLTEGALFELIVKVLFEEEEKNESNTDNH